MKKLFSYMMVCGAMMTAVLGFTSCEDDLDVQQAYPFTVETMPVPKRLVQGETAEIRCEIVREGYFSDTRYTIRYFQPDGEGTLRMDDGMVLLPNDRYPLDRDVFRLYYTSECEDQQTIDVYFEDNHDQLYQLTFTFNNEAKEEENTTEGNTITPIGTIVSPINLILNQRWQALACRVSAAITNRKKRIYENKVDDYMSDLALRICQGTDTRWRLLATIAKGDFSGTVR